MKSPLHSSLRIAIASSMVIGTALAQAPSKVLLDVAVADDAVQLEASIHGPFDAKPVVWGAILASANGKLASPLPGLSILAQPTVLASGPLDDSGRLVLWAKRPAGGIHHVQAVALHTDLSIGASAVHKVDLSTGTGSDDGDGGDPDALVTVLDRVRVSVEVMESEPPQYALVARIDADSDGYALVVHELIEARGRLVARFLLKVPGPGEGMLDLAETLSARVPLGTASAADAAVEIAVVESIRDGQDLKFYPVAIGR